MDGVDVAGALARPHALNDCVIGAGVEALSAFHTFGLVDHGAVVHNADRALRADVHALVGDAAAAGFGDAHALDRALVAGDLDNFDDIRIMLVAAHCELDALLHDRALLIDTAAHCRLILDDQLRDLVVCSEEIILKPIPRNLAQYLVFQVLYLGIKFSHA